MIIIPYMYKRSKTNKDIVHIKILLQDGTTVWNNEVGESDDIKEIESILETDEIYYKRIERNDNTGYYYVEVDDIRTDIAGMYNWNEVSKTGSGVLCWRDFIILLKSESSNIWLKIPEHEPYKEYLEYIISNNIK